MKVIVNGVPITEEAIRFELDRLVRLYSEYLSPEEIRAQMPLLQKKACEQAIGTQLLIDEAERLQIAVSQEEIERRLRVVVDEVGGEEALEAMLRGQNLDSMAFRKTLERLCRVDRLVAQITATVDPPTDEEMREHYRCCAKQYRRPDRAQARHILIRPASEDPREREVARARLEEIRRRLLEGHDFADEAAAHSECPSGRRCGGSLGWIARGATLPEFDRILFSLKVGEVSEVFETPLGFHLVQKTDEAEGGEATYDEAREKVRDFLFHVARGKAIAAYVARLRKKARIEVLETPSDR